VKIFYHANHLVTHAVYFHLLPNGFLPTDLSVRNGVKAEVFYKLLIDHYGLFVGFGMLIECVPLGERQLHGGKIIRIHRQSLHFIFFIGWKFDDGGGVILSNVIGRTSYGSNVGVLHHSSVELFVSGLIVYLGIQRSILIVPPIALRNVIGILCKHEGTGYEYARQYQLKTEQDFVQRVLLAEFGRAFQDVHYFKS
jgi:hypothetical protein